MVIDVGVLNTWIPPVPTNPTVDLRMLFSLNCSALLDTPKLHDGKKSLAIPALYLLLLGSVCTSIPCVPLIWQNPFDATELSRTCASPHSICLIYSPSQDIS